MVIAEEMPAQPLQQWSLRLAEAVATPAWNVDTTCVLPLRIVHKAYKRAFEFRRATDVREANLVDPTLV